MFTEPVSFLDNVLEETGFLCLCMSVTAQPKNDDVRFTHSTYMKIRRRLHVFRSSWQQYIHVII